MQKLKDRKPASWRVLKLFKEMTMQSALKKRRLKRASVDEIGEQQIARTLFFEN